MMGHIYATTFVLWIIRAYKKLNKFKFKLFINLFCKKILQNVKFRRKILHFVRFHRKILQNKIFSFLRKKRF